MAQALYRKYRSRSFDEVVGQEHVTKTLKNALKSGKISHAYLFTGPHGVGKTSVARVLAHEINGLPYDNDDIHLDIIEIDAASNRRIDEIRELRERVHIAPTSAKYKVYIIDEVHMLTREAFNALLKTLEEPPAHCIFILATTEAHKLPETIISRTQRFSFKAIGEQQSAEHLASLAKSEKIDITPGALALLADFGGGSFRDSISLLDQLSSAGKIDEAKVLSFLGLPPASAVRQLLESVGAGDAQEVLQNLDNLRAQGVDAGALAKELAKSLRQMIVDGRPEIWTPALLKELLAVPASNDPDGYLEIALLETASENTIATNAVPIDSSPAPEAEPAVAVTEPEEPANPEIRTRSTTGKFSLEDWPLVLDKARSQSGPLYSTLRLAQPEIDGDTLTLTFQFPLHQKKLQQAQNLSMLGGIIEEVSGAKLKIITEVSQTAKAAPITKTKQTTAAITPDDSISSISNIFGSAEVLES